MTVISTLREALKVLSERGKSQGSMHIAPLIREISIFLAVRLAKPSRHVAPPKEWPAK